MSQPLILWIDPGIRKMWYAVINQKLEILDAWIILNEETKLNRDKQFLRLVEMWKFFDDIFAKYNITSIWVEKLYFTNSNQSNAEFVFWTRALLIERAIKKNCKIIELTPTQLKKAITSTWKAEKKLMQTAIMKIFKLKDLPKFHDTADALWLALVASKKFRI
jgi:crossover junction endodeoxyribonuclease RuvC